MAWAANATTSFIIPNSRDSSLNSTQGTGTFTGVAWIDVAHSDNSTWIGNVIFTPTAHTFWHRHEGGQLLKVTAGSGWVADRDGEARRVHAGDTAWCPPGTVHWHGADAGSYMIHYAAAFGATEWMEEVSDEDYAKAVVQL
ncbi:RmlC-like cupin [Corynespora cassiicola Philippines]|uniref:RmlC-like cupin n=1 Tax=Corynespora cassiicola Philippines TaxID=1448308 RepID=A0A2T2NMC8_CORCC|nr:RmlC-like cupin [Corynespora cassiicola Philippines]